MSFVFLPGVYAGPIFDGMPCIVCGRPVEEGKGAQAIPPTLPALHGGECLKAAVRAANIVMLPDVEASDK